MLEEASRVQEKVAGRGHEDALGEGQASTSGDAHGDFEVSGLEEF